MADYSYLVEVVADGENLGKIQFLSFFDTLKEVVDEFIDDRDVKEDINVELKEYTLKRVEKFSSKFKDFVRIRSDSVLADGDVLRAVFSSSDHASGNPIDSM
jgi:hypothetical protein